MNTVDTRIIKSHKYTTHNTCTHTHTHSHKMCTRLAIVMNYSKLDREVDRERVRREKRERGGVKSFMVPVQR